MRRGDQHGVDRAGVEHVLIGVEFSNVGRFGLLLNARFVGIAYGGQDRAFDLIQVADVKAAHVAQADDSETDFIHERLVEKEGEPKVRPYLVGLEMVEMAGSCWAGETTSRMMMRGAAACLAETKSRTKLAQTAGR